MSQSRFFLHRYAFQGYFRHEARSPPLIGHGKDTALRRVLPLREPQQRLLAIIGLTFHLVENDHEIHLFFRAIVRQIKQPFRPHEIQLVKQYGQDVLILFYHSRLIF